MNTIYTLLWCPLSSGRPTYRGTIREVVNNHESVSVQYVHHAAIRRFKLQI
jgi:hypothetical protein